MSSHLQKKIEVCHVVNALDVGGMENGAVNLFNTLNRSRFVPMICCLYHTGMMTERLEPDVKVFDMGLPQGKAPFSVVKLALFFRKTGPDIVHTHGWGGGSLYAIAGAKLAGVPVIINGEHGSFFLRPHQVMLQKVLGAMCDVTLSVSESLKVRVVQNLGISPEKIRVIPNGVDTDIFSGKYDCPYLREELKRKFGIIIDDDSVVIGCIGSLKPEKNQVMLLKALREIKHKKAGKQIKAIFVGDGADLPDLVRFVKDNGLLRDVAFLGNRKDIPQLLSAVNVLISTSISRHEGMSNVILEAMSSNLPVIATKSIGTADLVRDGLTGFLIDQDDVAGLGSPYKTVQVNNFNQLHIIASGSTW
jgi:glycosyltransferase involved in cell wall biosynthesis